MGKIKLPKRYNYAEAYLTFKCGLGCEYCINDNDGIVRNRNELDADEWIESLNKINFGKIPLTLGGGEPTTHNGFYDIVNGINKSTKIDLLTNLQFNTKEFIKKVDPETFQKSRKPAYKSIRVSFHPDKMNTKSLVKKVNELNEEGYNIGIFGINHPRNTVANMQMSELARKNKIYFFIKDFLGEYKGKMFGYYKYPSALKKKNGIEVYCRTKELLIDPEGDVYNCHRDLYHKENAMENITDKNFLLNDAYRLCKNYGKCNPCDVKIKTNRFLHMGNCSVDILDKDYAELKEIQGALKGKIKRKYDGLK